MGLPWTANRLTKALLIGYGSNDPRQHRLQRGRRNFLARRLGGQAEPIGDTLKGATAQVLHGAEYAPRLAGTLPGK